MPEYAIERDPLLADERPDTLAKRVEVVLHMLAAISGAPCTRCAAALCPHDALASLILGFQREPRCTDCLAHETSREATTLRDQLTSFALSKDCLAVGWRWAGARERDCAWFTTQSSPRDHARINDAGAPASHPAAEPAYDAEWNAGDLACGELVLELRARLRAMRPGEIMKLTARDAAAPQDLPAWCRLTGHTLIHAIHPIYFIRRKEH